MKTSQYYNPVYAPSVDVLTTTVGSAFNVLASRVLGPTSSTQYAPRALLRKSKTNSWKRQ